MKRYLFKTTYYTFVIFVCLGFTYSLSQNKNQFEGVWLGKIGAENLIFSISVDQPGKLTGTLTDSDKGISNIPLSNVSFKNDTLTIALKTSDFVFKGTLEKDAQIIKGKFTQREYSLPWELKRVTSLISYLTPRINKEGERQLNYDYLRPPKITDGWETSSLDLVGMDSTLIKEMIEEILNEAYENIHSVLIVKNGKLVLEEYFFGFHRKKIHPIHSVTKSFTSALFGIAKIKNFITDLDESVSTYFPEYKEIFSEGKKGDITLRHLLTMTAGFAWNENTYTFVDPRNDHLKMDRYDHPIQYVFERPLENEPGEKFLYNSGISIVLGDVIKRTTNMLATKFAREFLFGHLGITKFYWAWYPDSTIQTGGGLSMLPRDMAKFGYLYLNDGNYKGAQIVPKQWLQESTKRFKECEGAPYGYQWWVRNFFYQNRILKSFYAIGWGGQYIFVLPSLDLVVVFPGGNHFNGGQSGKTYEMVEKFILPSMKEVDFEKQETAVHVLKELNWKTEWVSQLGCVKGCLEYLNIDIPDYWLFGGTGYAFILNIHKNVEASGPEAWDTEMIRNLGKNLGYVTETYVGHKSQPDFALKKELTWHKIQEAIDSRLPCYGFDLDFPAYSVIFGYDDCGYFFKGPNTAYGKGPKSWKTLGDTRIGAIEMCVVKPGKAASIAKTIKDALEFAVEFSNGGKWKYYEWTTGLAGYDLWIEALQESRVGSWGMATNALAYAELRNYAVEFLKEAKAKLPSDIHELFDEAILHYTKVAENLDKISSSFPYKNTTSAQRENNIKDKKRVQSAIKLLQSCKLDEAAGLEVLGKIVEKL